jgi:hypothetical protein
MKFLPVIKAPFVVQASRIVFALYAALFVPLFFMVHVGIDGFYFLIMALCSLLGIVCSCVRTRRSQLILAVLCILIPPLIWLSMLLVIFNSKIWWLWPLVLFTWLATSVGLALFLLKNRKAIIYFQG